MRKIFYTMLVALGVIAFLSCSKDEEVVNYPDGDEIRLACDNGFSLHLPVGTYVINGKKNVSIADEWYLGIDKLGFYPEIIQGAKNYITFFTINSVQWVDVTKCPALESLDIGLLNVGGIVDASNCLNLNSVEIGGFSADTLNFSGCVNLSDIDISLSTREGIGILNLSRSSVTEFVVNSPVMRCDALDFSECTKLRRVNLNNWNIEKAEISFEGCTALNSFKGSYYTYAEPTGYVFTNFRNETLDFSGCTSLDTVVCRYYLPRNLILDGCTSLRYLDCSDSHAYRNDYRLDPPFDTLDLRACPALTYLNCSYIGLTSLDISENKNLRDIRCYGNDFSTEEINKIYEALPVVEDGYIAVDYDDFFREPIGNYEIAESKGWSVSGTSVN